MIYLDTFCEAEVCQRTLQLYLSKLLPMCDSCERYLVEIHESVMDYKFMC